MASLQRAKCYIYQIATSGYLFLEGENEKKVKNGVFLKGYGCCDKRQ